MTPLAQAWIERLESNEYPQALARLRTTHGYCCWGVAATVLPDCEFTGPFENTYDLEYGEESFSTTLPLELVQRFFPNATEEQALDIRTKYEMMNDGGKSFKEIAAELRKDIQKWTNVKRAITGNPLPKLANMTLT